MGHADFERAKLFDQLRDPHKAPTHIEWKSRYFSINKLIEGFNRPSTHGDDIKKEILTNKFELETLPLYKVSLK